MLNVMKALILVIPLILIIFSILYTNINTGENRSLFVYCAAGLKPAMDEIVEVFEKETKIKVEITYAGTGTLANQILTSNQGDLFIAADPEFLKPLFERDLLIRTEQILKFIPVIAVFDDNPQNVTKLEDLTKTGVRVGIGEAQVPAIGRISKIILEKAGIYDEVLKNVVVETATVNELATYIKSGAVDAGIIWKSMAINTGLKYYEIPSDKNIISYVTVAILRSSRNIEDAELFLKFLKSAEAKEIFEKHGFTIYE